MKASTLLEVFNDVDVSYASRQALQSGGFRLDAAFYSPSAIASQSLLSSSGLQLDRCGQIADIYSSNLRERTFVSSKHGIALIGGHNLDTEDDRDFKYVSKIYTPQYEVEKLLAGDVLLSSAGTIGFFDFVLDNHEGRMASQHIIRARARPGQILPGYLYAYLSSPLALSMVTNQPSGSVIVTLYTENLANFPVPRLPIVTEKRIHELILRSFSLRNECRNLQQTSRDSAIQANRLPPLPYEDDELAETFRLPAQSIFAEVELRLEAHFHNSIARRAIASIRQSPAKKETLADITRRVFFCNRFTRTFVEAEHGIPYLAGRNIVQIRPRIENYLSTTQTEELQAYKLQRGWILITCSGTIGRTSFVWHNFEKFVATHDLIRVLPDESKVDPGYLYAFLSSPYGYQQILRFRHGSVIDHVTPEQIQKMIVPIPAKSIQLEIGDNIRLAYEKRAEALKLEDQAQEILFREIKGKST
jgi:type I restriction enzyme S subunit